MHDIEEKKTESENSLFPCYTSEQTWEGMPVLKTILVYLMSRKKEYDFLSGSKESFSQLM